MTSSDSMSARHHCGDDAAAYALGALEPTEATAFREHLQTCAICRDEVAAFQQAVDALPMAAPQHPLPKRLRRRVGKELRSPRQQARATIVSPPVPRRASRLLARPALTAATIVAVLAILATATGLHFGSGQPGTTRTIAANVIGLPGTAQLRVANGHAELIVRHLPQPPPGHVYEVWLKRPQGSPMPTTALFSTTTAGAGDIGIPGSLRGISQILVTPEPAGGSAKPTHAPVITAQIA